MTRKIAEAAGACAVMALGCILAKVNGKIAAARENNMLVTAFHPELSKDLSVHHYFIEMIKERGSISD